MLDDLLDLTNRSAKTGTHTPCKRCNDIGYLLRAGEALPCICRVGAIRRKLDAEADEILAEYESRRATENLDSSLKTEARTWLDRATRRPQ